MVEQIVDYCNRELGAYNLVFKNFKILYYLFRLSIWGFGLCSLYYISKLAYRKFFTIDLLAMIPIALFIILFFVFNNKSKKELKEKHSIVSVGFIWRDYQFENLQMGFLEKYLEESNLKSEKKIQHILSLINKDADDKKYKGFIWPGVGLAFLLPIWSQAVTWSYKQVNTIHDLLSITIYMTMAILFLFFMVFITKYAFKDTADDIINSKANNLKAIARLLENVHINLMKD